MANRLQLRHCRYLHVVASGGWGRDGGAHDDKHAPAASLPILSCCCFGGLWKGCQFSICCVFCGMSFLGWILELSFLFSIFSRVCGSPRPVSYTAKRFSDQPISLIFFSWDVLPRMDC